MKIDLDAIKVIDAIVRYGSYANAAEKLHKVRSALTYTINKLEDELGVLIFDRTGHKAILTPVGEEILEHGRNILLQCQLLEDRVQAAAGGWEEKLHISYNDLIPIEYIFPILKEFQQNCPHTQLTISAERLNGTIESVTSGEAALCIGASRDLPDITGYASVSLPTIDFAFALSPEHPLAGAAEPLTNENIMQYYIVSATDTCRQLEPRTIGIMSGQKTLRVTSIDNKIKAQIAGLGVGFLPIKFIQSELAAGKLIIKKVEQSKPSLPLTILWRTNPMGKALNWLVERLKQGTDIY